MTKILVPHFPPFFAILAIFSGYAAPNSKRMVRLRSESRASSLKYPHAIVSRILFWAPIWGGGSTYHLRSCSNFLSIYMAKIRQKYRASFSRQLTEKKSRNFSGHKLNSIRITAQHNWGWLGYDKILIWGWLGCDKIFS